LDSALISAKLLPSSHIYLYVQKKILKIIAALFFLFIFASLASALYYMVKDKGQSTRMLKSLTLRIGLSIVLFAMLMLGYYFGIIPGKQ